MSKRRHVITIEENILPKALIISGEHIADYLGNSLIDQGCEVDKKENYSAKLPRYDYIFQFGNFPLADEALEKHLKSGGKFLFIETYPEEDITYSQKIKILRVGDVSLWSPQELVEKILKTIFLTKEPVIVDARRKLVHKKPLPQAKETPVKPGLKDHSRLLVKKSALPLKKIIIFSFLLLLIFLVSLGGFIAWRIFALQNTVHKFRSHIASSYYKEATIDLRQVHKEINNFRKIYGVSSQVLFFLRDASFFKDIGAFLSVSDSLLTNTEELLTVLPDNLSDGSSFPMFGQGVSKGDFMRISSKIKDMQQTVISAKRELDNTHLPFFPKDSFSAILSFMGDRLVAASEIIPLMEKIIFTEEKKVYFILFQNNMELRPTGGFIGSYGLVTIQNGKILDFKIEDVYTADGQLRGHVEPPLPIKKYLSQPHFFLRDSNFDPDFAASAARAAWFLEKEMGTEVDGVIGINLFFIEKLLRVTGGLRLPDFNNEEITADNFFQKAHTFTQGNFFPGSTQKKDFLRSLATALLTKLGSGKEIIWFEILPKIKESLEEKNIILTSSDESLQKIIEEKGFGGRMTDIACVSDDKSCYPDYLSVIEANLGVNKVNYFINKSVTVEKKISSSREILSLITLSYENSATNEIYTDATYVNYLRVYVPAGSMLQSVTLNNMPIAQNDLTVEGYGSDKTVFGFLVRITSGSKGTVKITYTLPHRIEMNDSSYQLFFQKQGGDKTSPLVLSMLFPKNWKFAPSNFKSTSSHEGEIYYTTATSVDRIFAVDVNY